MRHFLARVVERARGTAPRVEPIIAPRFAPASAAEAAPETEAAPKSNGEKMPAPPDKPAALPIAAREGEPTPPRSDATEAPIETTNQTLLVPPEIPEAPAPFVVRQTKIEVPLPFLVRQTELVEHEATSARSSVIKPVRGHSTAQAARPLRLQPIRDRQPAPISPNDDQAEPRIVKITIGRIDVRATPAPAPPSRKTAPSSGPKLTLEAYLKSRKEGTR